ncbi:hypothetical protein M7I_6794 [Glarea lozoyensis 74030]|uniref:Uncharacterized protein n=1 Tax=Glarea lozoyensis (strain ATCC 74030 / MF5533) TaxID=1104152 RepID=H0EVJ6_GLAL7|nr:hypothetical protein M7I_6794 [Glarea lozoyensis 74030]
MIQIGRAISKGFITRYEVRRRKDKHEILGKEELVLGLGAARDYRQVVFSIHRSCKQK